MIGEDEGLTFVELDEVVTLGTVEVWLKDETLLAQPLQSSVAPKNAPKNNFFINLLLSSIFWLLIYLVCRQFMPNILVFFFF